MKFVANLTMKTAAIHFSISAIVPSATMLPAVAVTVDA